MCHTSLYDMGNGKMAALWLQHVCAQYMFFPAPCTIYLVRVSPLVFNQWVQLIHVCACCHKVYVETDLIDHQSQTKGAACSRLC